MKKQLLYLLAAVTLTSCNSSFYQIISTESSNVLKAPNGSMVYQDNNCSITYDLWAENGNSGFLFTNKTDEDIYIDLSESFFIMNGIAYDYYLNRTYTSGKAVSSTKKETLSVGGKIKPYYGEQDKIYTSAGTATIDNYAVTASVAQGISANMSVSFKEKSIICIPGNSSKYFQEYDIMQSLYRECGYKLYPGHNEVKSLVFTENNSPIKFANKICYKIGKDTDPIVVTNEFYAGKITNKTSKVAKVREEITQDCDGESFSMAVKILKMVDKSPDSFYIRYGKSVDTKTKY